MSKQVKCSEVKGFVGGDNTRDAWTWLPQVGEHGAVMFRSELSVAVEGEEEDKRTVLFEMLFGETATDKTRKEVLNLVKEHDNDGTQKSQWALTYSILRDGQQEPSKVVVDTEGGGGLLLFSGARRWFANALANILDPEHPATFLCDYSEITDAGAARNLGHALNATHKGLSVVEEGKRYAEMHDNEMSDRQIAEHCQLFIKGTNKPNIQRVNQLRKLWSNKVTDADRAKIEAGTATVDSVIKKAKGETSTVGKKGTRDRVMKFDKLQTIAKADIVEKILEAEGDKLTDPKAVALYFLKVASQKQKLPQTVQEILDQRAANAKQRAKKAAAAAVAAGVPEGEPEGATSAA